MAKEPAIPGSAQDDLDRLRMLFLRANELDQSVRCKVEVHDARPGAGWCVTVSAADKRVERKGACATELIQALVAELSRKLLLRWRSDGGALQLCGVALTAFDPPDPEVIEMPSGRELPAAPHA